MSEETKDGVTVSAHASASVGRDDPAYAQALLDQADAEVERVAKKAGVPAQALPRCKLDFAKRMVPHAGREASIHSVSHYRRYFQGYADALKAGPGSLVAPTHHIVSELYDTPKEALHFFTQSLEGEMTDPTNFKLTLDGGSGKWVAVAEWVEPGQ
jgi:hypothetical protein